MTIKQIRATLIAQVKQRFSAKYQEIGQRPYIRPVEKPMTKKLLRLLERYSKITDQVCQQAEKENRAPNLWKYSGYMAYKAMPDARFVEQQELKHKVELLLAKINVTFNDLELKMLHQTIKGELADVLKEFTKALNNI